MHKLRQLKLLLLYLLSRQPRDPLRPVVCRFWITPFDVELTRAASHSYLSLAGLGRWCWSFHNINWQGLMRDRWAPLTQSELVNYRRAAKIFTTVEVTTTLIWWDDKMCYLEHRLTQGEKVSAIVFARGTFFAGKERISPNQCVVGIPAVPPMARPGIVDVWNATDSYLRQAANAPPSSSQQGAQ